MKSLPTKQIQESNQEMFLYLSSLAERHFNSSLIKDKDDKRNKESYYKAWVNDMFNILYDYEINIEKFINHLINNKI